MKTKYLTTILKEETYISLQELSVREGRSMSATVRLIVEKEIEIQNIMTEITGDLK